MQVSGVFPLSSFFLYAKMSLDCRKQKMKAARGRRKVGVS